MSTETDPIIADADVANGPAKSPVAAETVVALPSLGASDVLPLMTRKADDIRAKIETMVRERERVNARIRLAREELAEAERVVKALTPRKAVRS